MSCIVALFDRDAWTLCPHARLAAVCVLSRGCHDNFHGEAASGEGAVKEMEKNAYYGQAS